MKTFKNAAALALFLMPLGMNAQVVYQPAQQYQQQSAVSEAVTANSAPQNAQTLTNDELSRQYKLQLDVINNEIKTLKSQQKLYKTDAAKNAEVTSLLASKKAEMADVKSKKKIVDKAIKTEKAQKKAEEKAEKAKKKAEAAAAKAAALQK